MADKINDILFKMQLQKKKNNDYLNKIKESIAENIPPSEQAEKQRKSIQDETLIKLNSRINNLQNLINNSHSVEKLVHEHILMNQSLQSSLSTNRYQEECNKLIKENSLLHQQLVDREMVENNLRQEIRETQRQVQTLKKQIEHLQNKITKKSGAKISSSMRKLDWVKAQLAQSRQEITKLKLFLQNNNFTDEKLKKDIEIQVKMMTLGNTKLKDQCQQLTQKLEEVKIRSFRFEKLLTEVSGIRSPSTNQSEEMFEEYKIQISKYFKYSGLLKGSQIVKQNFYRKWLFQKLQRVVEFDKIDSKLLFKYDKHNTTGFHHYINEKYNLLLLVQLSNGTIIGGYSYFPLQKNRIDKPGRGFIFNLNNRRDYYPKTDSPLQVVTYDDFYIIFGNAEIRLRQQQLKVFSNFGIGTSFFQANTSKLQDFMGQNCKELPIETYEVFQLIIN